MGVDYRLVEALALLPMLHVEPGAVTVCCGGALAEGLAADCLRWRDVERVYVATPPPTLRDKRICVGMPPAASCDVVIVSPGTPLGPWLYGLKPDGVLNTAVMPGDAPALYRDLRTVFPRGWKPWREHVANGAVFGALAGIQGVPTRQREPPKGARRLSAKYLPCLFTFAQDELPVVFGASPIAKPG